MKAIIDLFKMPTPTELANRELVDAQRGLLQAQDAAEFATNMVNYHAARIRRLSKYRETSVPSQLTAA